MGRFQGRRGNNGGRGRGRSTRPSYGSSSSSKKTSTSDKTKRKSLSDHVYYVGSAKQASDFVTVTNYLINYIRKNFKKGNDIALALETYTETDFTARQPQLRQSQSQDPDEKTREDKQYEKQFEVEYTEFSRAKTQYEDNKSAADALIWGQCTNSMKAKIQARKDYYTEIKGDPIKLLAAIKQHALNYESTQYRFKTIFESLKCLVELRQRQDESAIDYVKRYKAGYDVFMSHVGKEFCFPVLMEEDQDFTNKKQELENHMGLAHATRDAPAQIIYDDERKKLELEVKVLKKKLMDPFWAFMYLDNADKARYGSIAIGLDAQFSLGNDQYPKSLLAAQSVVENHTYDEGYKNRKKLQQQQHQRQKDKDKDEDKPSGLSFAQMKSVCYCCGKGHKLDDCPTKHSTPKDQWHINKAKESKQYQAMVASIEKTMNANLNTNSSVSGDTTSSITNPTVETPTQNVPWQFLQYNHTLTEEEDLSELMIIDSGASTDLFCKKAHLQNVRRARDPLVLTTNAGTIKVEEQGDLQGYGELPVHESAVTNIFALANLCKKFRVTFDSAKDEAFLVHTPDKVMRFAKTKSNLYAYKPQPVAVERHSLVQTVEENMNFHTPREVQRAKRARELLVALGSPSVADLKAAIAINGIANLPVTTADVDLAEKIFGKDIGIIKGKTTRQRPVPLTRDQLEIPPELYERSNLEMCLDVMYVNGMPFLTTITRALYYRTALYLTSRTAPALYATLDEVLRLYNHNGFEIERIYADNEFKSIMDPVKDDLGVAMEYSAPQAHVPEAERNNRTLKERVRATYHRLPYSALPTAMMKVLVTESARKLNFFPNKNGLSKYFSPRQILHRVVLDYKDCQYLFGSYVQAHDEPDPTNTQAPRSIDAIYMRPVGNSHEVYDLSTQRIIERRRMTVLPITPTIIKAVEDIATQQNQKGLRIKTKRGLTIYDSTWTAGVDYESDEDEDDSDYEYASEDEEDDEDSNGSYEHEAEDFLYEEESAGVPEEASINDDQSRSTVQAEQEEPHSDTNDQEEQEPETVTTRRSTRTRTQTQLLSPTMTGTSHGSREQNHLMIPEAEGTLYEHDFAVYAVQLLTAFKERVVKKDKLYSNLITYSLQKGIKKFGRTGFDSAKGEMQQLHDRECWQPIKVETMSSSEKKKALESLIFLVEKKSGTIKARHCANGSKQREWINSDEAASPTVMTESVMLTATVEAKERRDVATFDIPNAFIQTHVDEKDNHGDRIIMKIRGAMVDMLIEVDPSYEDYVVEERGQKILYVHILRAIYGMLMSGLLFYKKFRASIEKIGYKVNPYDPCVANKTIKGKQHTISWHVDDLKSSHIDPKINDEFHNWLRKEYGQVKEITSTRGTKHVYLGMTLDYSVPGEVKIDMTDYVKEMIKEFPEELPGTSKSAASENLFKVDKGKQISKLKAEAFHTFVAKALFLCKRARPDINPAVAFLCTRVQVSNSYDWSKLVKMMDFLKKTEDDCLTLAADDSSEMRWSVDAAFAVHPDMKSHTGITMTMGRGSIISASKKQKLNTRSSTEAELVAVDDAMAHIIWSKNFLEAQGIKLKPSTVLQDNESSMKLENNGQKSVGQRSRHINIRYFFITDQVEKGKIKIEYCPTDEIESDYMTKPLTGAKGAKHRNSLMNL